MKWKKAHKDQQKKGCDEALALALKAHPTEIPEDNVPSGLFCKLKIGSRSKNKDCDNDCPKKK